MKTEINIKYDDVKNMFFFKNEFLFVIRNEDRVSKISLPESEIDLNGLKLRV